VSPWTQSELRYQKKYGHERYRSKSLKFLFGGWLDLCGVMDLLFIVWSSELWHCSSVGEYWCFRGILPPFSAPKMEATHSYETLLSAHKTTWCHNSEDHNLHNQYSKNLKFKTSSTEGMASTSFPLLLNEIAPVPDAHNKTRIVHEHNHQRLLLTTGNTKTFTQFYTTQKLCTMCRTKK
jgi:hypothetical protein